MVVPERLLEGGEARARDLASDLQDFSVGRNEHTRVGPLRNRDQASLV